MGQTMNAQNWATFEHFVVDLNKHRLANPNQWIMFAGDVCGKHVIIKNFGLWPQQLTVNGWRHSGDECRTTKAWKALIISALEYELPAHMMSLEW